MTPPRSRTVGTIRPYEAKDREAVREISRRTAYNNVGSEAVFEDGELFADYWCNYYTDYEPESALVVEEEGIVVAYLLGCLDSRRFVRIMGRRIVPKVLLAMLWNYVAFRYRRQVTRRTVRWFLLHSWREAPHVPMKEYPAHYHCNVMPSGYGKSYYSKLATVFVDRLAERGITALNGQFSEPVRGGPITTMQRKTRSFENVFIYRDQKPSSFLRYVLGDTTPMVNLAFGMKIGPYREWLKTIETRFGI